MSESLNKNRVIFLDLLRAVAIILLIFALNIDHTLAPEYKNTNNFLLSYWQYINTMVVPFFVFTSGTLFMYLYKTQDRPFSENPVVKRGIRRGIILIITGYLLNLHGFSAFYSEEGLSGIDWESFLTVDILQLLGVSILFTIFVLWISSKMTVQIKYIMGIVAVVVLILTVCFELINLGTNLPLWAGAYFTRAVGSHYTFFPHSFYFFAGCCAGCFMSSTPESFENLSGVTKLLIAGLVLIIFSFVLQLTFNAAPFESATTTGMVVRVCRKAGLIIMGLIAVIHSSIILKQNPKIFILLARNTLLVYVINKIMIDFTPLSIYYTKVYDVSESILVSLGTTSLMVLIVIVMNKLNFKNISMMRG